MPQAARFEADGAMLRAEPLTEATGPVRLVWLHGWGQSRESLRPLALALLNIGESWLIDLPGFGEAPPPPTAMSPASYSALLNAWLATQPAVPTIFIGHSMGFRVAIHQAMTFPTTATALISLAGAGVPRALTFAQFLRRKYIRLLISTARVLKPIIGEATLNALRQRFGSRDYLATPPALKPTFLAVVNDDVTSLCPHISQPTLLVYGENDTETPPNVGQRFANLLPHAKLVTLPHHDHYSILAAGRHVVENHIRQFISSLKVL